MTHSRWHGAERYFGLHYDLHAGREDDTLGLHADPGELAPLLSAAGADFVQTDCKGHPGYTSWFSRTPDASVPPLLKGDALEGWREATRRLGLPLHCHYSGVWDKAAGEKHPEWSIIDADGRPLGVSPGGGAAHAEKMCPRGDYLPTLMIPQMRECIDRYGVDGFWVDGDLWASEPCYCPRCRAAFTERTGIAEPPRDPADPRWPAWIGFALDSFNEYVTRYAEAVHAHKPSVLVCSNWLQTFRNPGPPAAPTDWISGDNAWVWGMDGSRCEARFISTRGKHWDIMLWSFYCSHGMGEPDSPWAFKPVEMLQQEAAVTLALGGALQVYETADGVRDGRLVLWRVKLLGEVGAFAHARRALCQDTETVPQLAVLHSEVHCRSHMGRNLMNSVDPASVQGAVFSLLECHYNVDILDEWALLPRRGEFPVIVAPEQTEMSDAMVAALKDWVLAGGRLLLSGAGCVKRFGEDFLGVRVKESLGAARFHVPADGGSVPVYSDTWLLAEPADSTGMGRLERTSLPDAGTTGFPAWTLRKAGAGAVAFVPFDVFRSFNRNRYPRVRRFIGDVARVLAGRLSSRVEAPSCVDVVLRRKGERLIAHFINRASGIPASQSNGAIDEIPPVGPVVLEMDLTRAPRAVTLAFEEAPLAWEFALGAAGGPGGTLRARLERVHIHAAVVVDPGR